MSESHSYDALMSKLSERLLHHDVKDVGFSILFLGFAREQSAALQTHLRSVDMAPRCRQLTDEQDFIRALSERSWDMLISAEDQEPAPLKVKQAAEHVQRLGKDLPIIHISDKLFDTDSLIGLLKLGVVPVNWRSNLHLLTLYIHRELEQLRHRRSLRQTETMLEKVERRSQEWIDDSRTPVCYVQNNLISHANASFCHQLGLEQCELVNGLPLERFIDPDYRSQTHDALEQIASHSDQPQQFELDVLRFDGTRFRARLELAGSVYQEQECVQIQLKPSGNEDAEVFSHEDPISGLYNKPFFLDKLDDAITADRVGGKDCHLLYLSLDNYANLLDEFGPEAADVFTREMGQLLRHKIHPPHLCAHFDEGVYGILFYESDPQKASHLARQLCLAVADIEVRYEKVLLHSTCSIGVAMVNDSAPRVGEMLNRAIDAAQSLHSGSRQGNGYSVFRLQQKRAIAADSKAVQRVLDAITHNRFRLLFQPIVPLKTEDKASNYEVLLRLITEDREEISPVIFMSSISDDAVMARMDMWVLEECILQLRQQLDQGNRNRLFINVTGRTLRNRTLLPWLAEQLRTMRLPADHLVFQISEADALAHPNHFKAFCTALKKLHCRICIKHYGSTSDSEQLIREVPVDYIKLDGNFVKDLSKEEITVSQLDLILHPLLERKLLLIVPMVEDTRLMPKLYRLGVHLVQGHYLQPPRPQMDYAFFDD